MVQLRMRRPARRVLRRRDFAATKHEAPKAVRQLSRIYHQQSVPAWRPWLYLAVAVVIIGLMVGIIYSPIFTIRNIVVNNLNFKPTEVKLVELLKQNMERRRWFFLPQNNLIFFSRSLAVETVARELYLDDISINKHWPNVLKVNVTNNLVVGIWQAENGEFLLDRRGYLIQQLPQDETSDTLPTVEEKKGSLRSVGDQVIKSEIAVFIDELFMSWQQELPDRMPSYLQIDMTSLPTLRVYMPQGWYVNVTGESRAIDQVRNLKRLLDERLKDDNSKLEYIDVRFGNRLYFKLK